MQPGANFEPELLNCSTLDRLNIWSQDGAPFFLPHRWSALKFTAPVLPTRWPAFSGKES